MHALVSLLAYERDAAATTFSKSCKTARNLNKWLTYESCIYSRTFEHRIIRVVPPNALKTAGKKRTEKIKKLQNKILFLVNLKLLSNHKELERVIYMKKMCLDDIFPMPYRLIHFYERFRKVARPVMRPLFSKLLTNRIESRKVFNMTKLGIFRSNTTVHYTPCSDNT